jgi:nicotinamidase-related amidase
LDPQALYLFGATLEQDIHATALSARTLGYDVVVIGDATGCRDENGAGATRAGLQRRGVKFETADWAGTEIVLWQKRMERERRQKAAH